MSYLIAVPCIAGVYLHTRAMELPGSAFALACLVMTVLLASANIVTPGVDALVALCISMAVAFACRWYVEREYQRYLDTEEPASALADKFVNPKHYQFCSQLTHDFAVSTKESVFAIQLINTREWSTLQERLTKLSSSKRQGFYANLNYSSISEKALRELLEKHPENADLQVLMGHLHLCKAKRLGLVPGMSPTEHTAAAIASAFRHFRRALRISPTDAEAMCGVLLAKTFISLREEHIAETLRRLLAVDELHFHGLLVAGRAMVTSAQSANRFVEIVSGCVDSRSATLAMARIIAHVECLMIYPEAREIDEKLLSEMRKQIAAYKMQMQVSSIGAWQSDIGSNITAFAHRLAGDFEEMNTDLKTLDGKLSPYPWQREKLENSVESGNLNPGSMIG